MPHDAANIWRLVVTCVERGITLSLYNVGHVFDDYVAVQTCTDGNRITDRKNKQ